MSKNKEDKVKMAKGQCTFLNENVINRQNFPKLRKLFKKHIFVEIDEKGWYVKKGKITYPNSGWALKMRWAIFRDFTLIKMDIIVKYNGLKWPKMNKKRHELLMYNKLITFSDFFRIEPFLKSDKQIEKTYLVVENHKQIFHYALWYI